MKLYLEGHEYRYAAEQIIFALFPGERPEYTQECPKRDEVYTQIRLSEGKKFVTASANISVYGKTASGMSRVPNDILSGKLIRDRECQKIIKLAVYKAAMKILPDSPPWGALTGIRPGTIFTKSLERGLSEKAALRRMEREYFVEPRRAELLKDTSRASLEIKSFLDPLDVALYVGIPFCPTRCAYCSFVSQSVEKSIKLITPFLDALFREIEATARVAKRLSLRPIAVYFGGGTPTILSADELNALVNKVRQEFDLSHVREFCVEAGRPDTITKEKLVALHRCGIDRISINPQTMSDKVLQAIGRRHSAEDVRRAYAIAREVGGFDINMDLIAGLPADDPEIFESSLGKIMEMAPENVTVHTLALKRGTKITLEGTSRPDAEAVSKMLNCAMEKLRGSGYKPYYLYRQKFMSGGFENVGWAKKDKNSLYNILIMEELCSILAMGGGASAKLVNAETGRIERIFNPKYPLEYIENIEKIISDKEKILGFYAESMEV